MVKAVETVNTIKKNSENKYHFTILITKNGPICDRRKKKKNILNLYISKPFKGDTESGNLCD